MKVLDSKRLGRRNKIWEFAYKNICGIHIDTHPILIYDCGLSGKTFKFNH